MLVTTTHFIQDVKSIKTALIHTPFVLRCLALVCLIVAMAMPRLKFTEQQTEGEGIDIILCFDISGSMTEQDFQPNRIEAAKTMAGEFVEQRQGDRIGVVIFSSVSFTLCPDNNRSQCGAFQIQNIQSGYLQEEGTAIGSGLATSVDHLHNSKSKSKVIILLTDGVDVGGVIPPDLAMQMAKQFKIKVYTLGIGSEKEIDEVLESPLGHIRQKRNWNLMKVCFRIWPVKQVVSIFMQQIMMHCKKFTQALTNWKKQKLKLLLTIGTKINFKPGSLLELFFCCWKLYCDILRLESFHDYFR
jgi:Ca-activated chloride channel homolog